MNIKQMFLSLLLCMLGTVAQAQTDAEYSTALTDITEGNYRIYAEVDGTKYYLKVGNPSGNETNFCVTTTSADEASVFAIAQNEEGSSKLKDTAWKITASGYNFTNPGGGNKNDGAFTNSGYLRGYLNAKRKSEFDRQVLYAQDGAYAVRATNSSGITWGAGAYWGLVTYNDVANCAGYVAEAAYIWHFELQTAKTDVTPENGYYRIYGSGSQAKSYMLADGATNVKGTGTNVAYDGSDNADVWLITGTGGTGTIKSLSAGTYVNIDSSDDGAGLVYLSSNAQELAFTKNPDGTWYIGANDLKAYRYLNFNKANVNVWSEDANDAIVLYQITDTDLLTGRKMLFTLTDKVATGGTISVEESGIGNVKKDAYVIYKVIPNFDGVYEAFAKYGTKNNGSSLAFDMDVDLGNLKVRDADPALTSAITNTGSWTPSESLTIGSFNLKAGQTYYLRLYFLQEGGSYVCNISEMGIKMAADQMTVDYVDVDIDGYGTANALYANDFEGKYAYPFWRGWAWEPNYIHVENGYAEFYYNQEAFNTDEQQRRQLKGAELTCGFTTVSEGWYGFRFYLSDGQFPRDITGSIIAQIFNRGNDNSWAGHLSLSNDKVIVSYRGGMVEPTTKVVGTVQWDNWIPVVMYFKAGRNDKGQIKVWLGDTMTEASPTVTADGINLGFGNWVDDNTLDDTDADGYVGASLGCKFGLYVSDTYDRTIRMDDIKALEGNPAGAFETVKPTIDTTTGISASLSKNEEIKNNTVFNLNGQRVTQPTQGLYIVNGKKIIR